MKKHKKLILFLIGIFIIFIVVISIYSSREKNFKLNLQKANKVQITNGNTGENIALSREDIEKLVNKIDEVHFKPVLFPKHRDGWSYSISYTINESDWWSMVFGGGEIQIAHNNDWKYYQYNRELNEYVGAMYKELGGK